MTLTGTVLDAARTHLGDNQAMDWQDTDILPKLQEAFRELRLKLIRAGIPLTENVTPDISVPANTSLLNGLTGYPDTTIIMPIWLFEKYPGQTDDNYVDMQPRSFIPVESPGTSRLQYWAWLQQQTQVRPCTQPTVVRMRYRMSIPVPTKNDDPVGIIEGDSFLSFRTAALCLEQMPGMEALAVTRNQEALVHLDDIVAVNVNLNQQMLPVRRKAYHRNNRGGNFWFGW